MTKIKIKELSKEILRVSSVVIGVLITLIIFISGMVSIIIFAENALTEEPIVKAKSINVVTVKWMCDQSKTNDIQRFCEDYNE